MQDLGVKLKMEDVSVIFLIPKKMTSVDNTSAYPLRIIEIESRDKIKYYKNLGYKIMYEGTWHDVTAVVDGKTTKVKRKSIHIRLKH